MKIDLDDIDTRVLGEKPQVAFVMAIVTSKDGGRFITVVRGADVLTLRQHNEMMEMLRECTRPRGGSLPSLPVMVARMPDSES